MSQAWNTFGLYVVLLCLLPSGTLFGFPLKLLAFLPLLFFAGGRLICESRARLQLSFTCLVIATALLYTFRSFMNAYYSEFALSQLKDLLTTFAGCLFIRLFTGTGQERARFVRICIFSVSFGSLLKLMVVGYAYASGASLVSLLERISSAFGVQLMTISLEDFNLRVQWPSDNLLPICVFALIAVRKRVNLSWWITVSMLALLLISTLLTFSRYIWISSLLGGALGLLVAKKDRLKTLYLVVSGILLITFLGPLIELVGLRFNSALAGESDIVRVWQITQLKEFFWQAPLFGHGMGTYPLNFKRSLDLPYAYEVQILSLFGEFGVLGIGLLLGLLFNYYRKAFNLREGMLAYQIAVAIMIVNFLGAGLFNPCLLVSFSAVCYGMCFVLAQMRKVELKQTQNRMGNACI